jgi:beta-lactam-binding protein with PASTA domain
LLLEPRDLIAGEVNKRLNPAMRALTTLRRLGIIIAIAATFLFGLATTVYLSLRSPEVRVPEVIGKDRFEAEQILGDAGLNFRVRATRPSNQSKPDTVLFQLPRAGEMVKVGQTVAMDISRVAKEGEASESDATDKKVAEEQAESATRTASEATEVKPRRRPANRNANDNANANSNVNAANKNRNANSSPQNANVGENANRTRNANTREANSNRSASPTPRAVVPGPSPTRPVPNN